MNEEYVVVNGIPLPNRRTRRAIVVYTLAFCSLVVGLVLWLGNPTNSLHTSALAWSYSVFVAVVWAYVFGAVADTYNVLKANK